jgi:hypothetical protein
MFKHRDACLVFVQPLHKEALTSQAFPSAMAVATSTMRATQQKACAGCPTQSVWHTLSGGKSCNKNRVRKQPAAVQSTNKLILWRRETI